MNIPFWRRIVQFGAAFAFIAIPVLNLFEFNYLSGNFLSFTFAGIPLADPLAVVQVAAGSKAVTTDMMLGAAVPLLLAVVMGPVFCSWICPFGLLSELVHPKRPERLDSGAVFKADQLREVESATNSSLRTKAVWFKFALVAVGVALVALAVPVPFLNQLSMPGWYSRAFQYSVLYRELLIAAVVCISLVLIAERVCRKRFWCRYCCPQSVLVSLFGLLVAGRWRVRFARKRCTCPASSRACIAACSLGLDPRSPLRGQRLQCTNCGDCVEVCKKRGKALEFGCGRVPR